jgi:cell division protein FtsQ
LYERGEARRFTRRSRRRRITWLVSALSLLLVVGFVTGAVYSPLLSLKTIRIEGASRVSAASVRAAVDGQIGRPLALVDFDSITRALGKFPLIRSFVTETVPPNTLVIRIAERAPIATLATSSGFAVVDPAGIVIESGADRQPGLPLIELGGSAQGSPAFVAAVGVLLALPADLLKKVDTVTAQTADDVTLTLATGQSVVWGSAEQSALRRRNDYEVRRLCADPSRAWRQLTLVVRFNLRGDVATRWTASRWHGAVPRNFKTRNLYRA